MNITTFVRIGFLVGLLVLTANFATAQPAPQDTYYASLSIGDTEVAVLHTMKTNPAEIKRRSVAGVEYTIMVFVIGKSRYTITLVGGRLVAKTVEAKPTNWPFF